ncbi:hypothetical protein EMGBS15_17730 [Filimonas sp.]|nr:hypothetical protein EMGBS15_17730 [Filimonas sp.]
MKKITILFAALCLAVSTYAQVVSFETLPLMPPAVYWKGMPGIDSTIYFQDGGATFINDNDTSSSGDFWMGWGYSANTDTVDGTFINDMSAITGKGNNNSNTYGVAYMGYDSSLNKIVFSTPKQLAGFYITNSTYAYKTILNGNFTSKKFGGTTGNDPDYFKIDITGWLNGIPKTDTVHFFLADYRDANNANDYIIKDWTFVDLSSLGGVDSLTYNLTSSDTNSFGMLTPSYFCIDDLESAPLSVKTLTKADDIEIYPVPMNDYLTLENNSTIAFTFTIMAINGQEILTSAIGQHECKKINTNIFAKGTYIIRFNDGEKTLYRKLVK